MDPRSFRSGFGLAASFPASENKKFAAEATPTSAGSACQAKPSVARTSASTFSGSNAECPDAGEIASSAFGQALCRSQAFWTGQRSEEHTSELQSLMRISYAVFCLKKKN